MTHDFFSTAQLFGHATLIISMVTFSRKRDSHFKLSLTVQNVVYAIHFFLMGNPAAVAGTMLAAARSLLSLRTRSMAVASILLTANLLLAFFVVKTAWNVIPLLATAIATISMFRLDGLRLRYGILSCTLLWLVNNILTGSIGGTVMEGLNTLISGVTIYRLHRDVRLSRATA
jgi:hypothetical protein